MDATSIAERLDTIAPLAEPVRRALYLYVIGRPEPVGRDEAARAVGVGRALAAFHLDRLSAAGLLTPEYRRLSGRTGPGAGRPAKLYRRSDRQIEVTIPERREGLVAQLFAMALDADRLGIASSATTLEHVAREYGTALGQDARRRAGPRPPRARLVTAALSILADSGFEPALDGGTILLRNCPFDRVARDHRDLVCGMNRFIMDGLVAGLRSSGLDAVFDPQSGRCCMTLVATPARST